MCVDLREVGSSESTSFSLIPLSLSLSDDPAPLLPPGVDGCAVVTVLGF